MYTSLKPSFLIAAAVTVAVYLLSTLSYVAYCGLHILLFGLVPWLVWHAWRGHRKQKPQKVSRRLGVALALLLIWPVESLFHHGSPSLTGEAHELHVLSYNLYFRNESNTATLQPLKQLAADVLAFQEVTPAWERTLERELATQYPYRKVVANTGTHGLAIYSRHPLQAHKIEYNRYDLPIAQQVRVHIGEDFLTLVNAHIASPAGAVEGPREELLFNLERNARLRRIQWDQITEEVGGGAVLVVGDLNTHRWEHLYQHIRRDFTEAHASAGEGWGLTFPTPRKLPWPVFRLDHIFARGPVQFQDAHVLQRPIYSDHLGVSARVIWQ